MPTPEPDSLLMQAARVGRRAALDPGVFTMRLTDDQGEYERLDQWQERALQIAVAELEEQQ